MAIPTASFSQNQLKESSFLPVIIYSLLLHIFILIIIPLMTSLFFKPKVYEVKPRTFLVIIPPDQNQQIPDIITSTPQKSTNNAVTKQSEEKKQIPQIKDLTQTSIEENTVEDINEITDSRSVPGQSEAKPANTYPSSGTTSSSGQSQPVTITMGSKSLLDNSDFSPLFNPKPTYPRVALLNNIEGFVNLELLINESGKIESASIVQSFGHPSFGLEVMKVIKQWRFPPPRIKGEKVKIRYLYQIDFTLTD